MRVHLGEGNMLRRNHHPISLLNVTNGRLIRESQQLRRRKTVRTDMFLVSTNMFLPLVLWNRKDYAHVRGDAVDPVSINQILAHEVPIEPKPVLFLFGRWRRDNRPVAKQWKACDVLHRLV